MNSRFATEGRTPEQWAKEFRSKGIDISERTLRGRARQLGAFGMLGRQMILLPQHIDTIITQESEGECHTHSTSSQNPTSGPTTLPSMEAASAAARKRRKLAEDIAAKREWELRRAAIHGAESVMTFGAASGFYLQAGKSDRFLAPLFTRWEKTLLKDIKPAISNRRRLRFIRMPGRRPGTVRSLRRRKQ